MRIPSALVCAVAAFLLALSVPGIPAQIRAIAESLGMGGTKSHRWNDAGARLALPAMFVSFCPPWRRTVRFGDDGGMTVEWPLSREIASIAAIVAVAGGLTCSFTREEPSF